MGNRGRVCALAVTILCCTASWAAPPPPPADSEKAAEKADFEHDNTFIDVSDALRSKQYVHRAILTSLVRDTNRFRVGRIYLSHMMGFNQVWQRGDTYAKYSSGLQGLAIGWVSPWGHGIEVGGELSAVSNIMVSYKYFIRPQDFSLWGVVGAGFGTEVRAVGFADGPPEAAQYVGSQQMGFLSLGLLVPTLEVGFKGEVRLNFYGMDRIVFTSGVGLILFL
ncbi:hypothetical protein K2X33_13035 [bacterium]|nr:hypothetical protein [bacterium]